MPSLKTLYLDFCNKLCNQNLRCLDNFQKLKSLSIFGCNVEIESGKQSAKKVQDVFEFVLSLEYKILGALFWFWSNFNHTFLIISVVKIQNVVRSTGEESEVQLREFASKRGLKLSNWSVVKKHMIKGMPFMLSQIYLTSLADRE